MTVVIPKKVKHPLMRTLPPERLAQVERMIARGDTPKLISTTIIYEWKLLTDQKQDTLRKAIQRYKDDMINNGPALLLEKAGLLDKASKLVTKIDVLEELYTLAATQKTRLNKVLLTESNMKSVLMDQVGREMSRMSELLSQISNLQMETGIVMRAPKNMNIKAQVVDEEGLMFRATPEHMREIEMFMQDGTSFGVAQS